MHNYYRYIPFFFISFLAGEIEFTEHAISLTALGAQSVYATDVDGDGDMDILSASHLDDTIAWYENDGSESFTEHAISTSADGAYSVHAADVDGDGDTDVLSTSLDGSNGTIAWYENDGSEPPVFYEHVIGADLSYPYAVYATDMNADGDMDVLMAHQSGGVYYINDGSESFTKLWFDNDAYNLRDVYVADVDGDGDMDVLSAFLGDDTLGVNDTIAWYENIGYDPDLLDVGGLLFTKHILSTSVSRPESVYAEDIDGDGDMDVLSGSTLSGQYQLFWYENDDNENFTEHELPYSVIAQSVYATDVDGDGHMDLLSALGHGNSILWHENDGNQNFTPHYISSEDFASDVYATDVNGDGHIDVLSASFHNNKIAWYEQKGPFNTYVPDDNFEQALIDLGYDTAMDDSVLTGPISSLEYLDVGERGISDLTGIEDFTDLTTLLCDNNELTSLNLSNNSALTELDARFNNLTCIITLNPSWATENWTYENGNIDEGVDFSLGCAPEGYTYIPDDNFEQTLIDNFWDDTLDDFVLTQNISLLPTLSINNDGISDLTGIEDFISLTTLNCRNNSLTSLDLSSNTALTYLDCENNQLTSLDVSANTALTTLVCSSNQLTSLDVSANTALTFLNCSDNGLTSLDVSANTALSFLYCGDNQLTSLDISSNTALTHLTCNDNQLTSLDVSNNTALTTLNCRNNSLTSLDLSSNTALTYLDCENNQLTSLNIKFGPPQQLISFTAVLNNLTCILTTDPSWATQNLLAVDEGVTFSVHCVPEGYTYIPDDNFVNYLFINGYGAANNMVPTENIDGISTLDVGELGISDLTGIEDFISLTTLNCRNNSLTSLDLSSNTALTYLDCENNQLTSLNVSNNTALTDLYVQDNGLTSLNVSNNTALTELQCHGNQLTSLDVSNNTALIFLNCDDNQLTSLDVSNNTALTELNCDDNQLTSLDVSANTALTILACSSNQLTNLDVSNNLNLRWLWVNDNQLTSLDVSNNTALEIFKCQNNQLTYLNMKNGVTEFEIDSSSFIATNNFLSCIEVNEEDIDYATANWTYESGVTDQGVVFNTDCVPQALFNNTKMNLVSVPGDNNQYGVSLSNHGLGALSYAVTVDASYNNYTWISTMAESGYVFGQSTVSVPFTLQETENLSAGTYSGYMYFSTNTGADPGVIVADTDTVTITLNLMSDNSQFTDTTVTVAAGNSEPITFSDESGQSLGIMVDFEYSDGGSVMVQSIGTGPSMNESTTWEDPDGLITDPVFPAQYFEISTDIAGDYSVDIGLDYTTLQGINDPQSLRLAKRPGYAGASEPWVIIDVANTEINTTDGLVVAKNQTSFSQWAMVSNSSDNSFMDIQGPVISNFAIMPAQPNILEDVIVTAELTDDTGIETATLHYKAGGGSGYKSVDMDTSGGSYSATIPGSDVSMNGLFYYIVAQDPLGSSSTSDTNGVSINFPALNLTTSSATGSAYPSGLPKDFWRLISIPGVLDEMGVGLVVGDELGTQDDNTWRIFRYDKITSSYKEDLVDFAVGESYWLYQRVEDNLTVSTPAGAAGNMSGTSLTITPGWNFIGSPYPFPVSLSLDQVQFYGPITYGLVGEEWSSVVTELDPWSGYVVFNRTASDKTILLDPGSTGTGLASRSLGQEEGWLINLQVSTVGYQDKFNTIGALSSAHDERDWHDNPEITAPGKSISLTFKIPDEEGTHGVTSDVRALDDQLKIWDARIRTQNLEGAVNLSWIIEQELHASKSVQVVDLSSRTVMDMIGQDHLNLGTVDSRYDHQIKIVAGDPEQVALAVDDILATIPEELSLNGNYPNPFNPVTTIRFGLPEPRKIRITVVNILGQEITELVNGWRDIGRHEVVWQGVDGSGKAMATGMYFTVLSDGNKIIVQKMLLLK